MGEEEDWASQSVVGPKRITSDFQRQDLLRPIRASEQQGLKGELC